MSVSRASLASRGAVLALLLGGAEAVAQSDPDPRTGPAPVGDLVVAPPTDPNLRLWASDASGVEWSVSTPLSAGFWRTTVGGTWLTDTGHRSPEAVVLGDRRYFVAAQRVFVSDGTALGTYAVTPEVEAQAILALSPHLYVLTSAGRWRAYAPDGPGLRLVLEHPAFGEIESWRPEAVDGRIWFSARANDQVTLWAIAGPDGPVSAFGPVSARRIFADTLVSLGGERWLVAADEGAFGTEPFLADADGLRRIVDLGDRFRDGASERGGFVGGEGRACFMGQAGASFGLVCSDGTAAGTRRAPGDAVFTSRSTMLWQAGGTVLALDNEERPWAVRSLSDGLVQLHEEAVAVLAATGAGFWLSDEERVLFVDAATLDVRSVDAAGRARAAAVRDDDGVWVASIVGPGVAEVTAYGATGDRVGALGRILTPRNASSTPESFHPLGAGAAAMIATVEGSRVWVRRSADGVLDVADFARLGRVPVAAAVGGDGLYLERGPRGDTQLRALGAEGRSRLVRAWSGFVEHFTVVGGQVFMVAYRDGGPTQAYRSDGTPEGTVPLPGLPTEPYRITWLGGNGEAVFALSPGRLWRYDPRADETTSRALSEGGLENATVTAVALEDQVLAIAVPPSNDARLWRLWPEVTDLGPLVRPWRLGPEAYRGQGVVVEANALRFVPATGPASTASVEGDVGGVLAVVDDLLFFSAADPAHGRELWVYDGASARRVADIAPGPTSSAPDRAASLDGRLVFAADDGATGREVWASDGTEAGTRRLFEVEAGPQDGLRSRPPSSASFVAIGDHIYFAGRTLDTGLEPWRFPRALLRAPPPPSPPDAGPPETPQQTRRWGRGTCGCRAAPRAGGHPPWLAFVLLAAAALRRREPRGEPGCQERRSSPKTLS